MGGLLAAALPLTCLAVPGLSPVKCAVLEAKWVRCLLSHGELALEVTCLD